MIGGVNEENIDESGGDGDRGVMEEKREKLRKKVNILNKLFLDERRIVELKTPNESSMTNDDFRSIQGKVERLAKKWLK